MTNYLIGYPRSGNNWCQNRLVLFCYKCLNQDLTNTEIVQKANISHFNYGISFPGAKLEPDRIAILGKNDNIFCHLRNAKAVLTSYFHYMNGLILPQQPELVFPKTLEELVPSPWGISRLCRFMNEIHDLKSQVKDITFLYYEDAFSRDFIKVIPSILALDYKMSEEEIDYIFTNSDFKTIQTGNFLAKVPRFIVDIATETAGTDGKKRYRKGKIDSYKEELTEDLSVYTDNYLRQHCRLPEYRTKYGL